LPRCIQTRSARELIFMRLMRDAGAFVIVAMLALPLAAQTSDDGYVSYSGTATARHTAKFLYGEHHVLLYRGGHPLERVVLYTCSDGSAFARKTATYLDPLVPDFVLEDASNGMREGVRSSDTQRTVFFRGRRVEDEKDAPLPRVDRLVVDIGFDEFIRGNWPLLMGGRSMPINFLVPSRLGEIPFEVQHVRSAVLEGTAIEIFHLKLSGLLGLVLPGFDVSYGATDHLLMRYEGVADLRDASGDNMQADIVFHSADRQRSNAEAAAAAKLAMLAPCRS
jgi:hypothetical protein